MIYFENDQDFCDENVCTQIKLPSVPRVGDNFWLNEETVEILAEKAKSDLLTAQTYARTYLYGFNFELEASKKDIERLQFPMDAIVRAVVFVPNSEIIHVELKQL